jgi:predicted RNA-binding protein YlqC (UPF0109 family)
LRDSASLIVASIDELTPVLNKVELAEKLHCKPTQLQTITVEFPRSKLGHVIGKNGSTIKKITEKTETAIDVDSDACLIEITGTDNSIEMAKKEIRKIIESIEKDVQVSPVLVEYLTTRVGILWRRLFRACVAGSNIPFLSVSRPFRTCASRIQMYTLTFSATPLQFISKVLLTTWMPLKMLSSILIFNKSLAP